MEMYRNTLQCSAQRRINECVMVIGSSVLCYINCLLRGVVISKDIPLADCTEAYIHITKTYSYRDNTDFTWNIIC